MITPSFSRCVLKYSNQMNPFFFKSEALFREKEEPHRRKAPPYCSHIANGRDPLGLSWPRPAVTSTSADPQDIFISQSSTSSVYLLQFETPYSTYCSHLCAVNKWAVSILNIHRLKCLGRRPVAVLRGCTEIWTHSFYCSSDYFR